MTLKQVINKVQIVSNKNEVCYLETSHRTTKVDILNRQTGRQHKGVSYRGDKITTHSQLSGQHTKNHLANFIF